MRKLTAVIAFIIASAHCCAQSAMPNFDTTRKVVDKILALDTFTAIGRMHFVLSVDKDKIVMLNNKNGSYGGTLSVPVTLTNNSPDTLRYMSMDCSWEDIYSSSNRGIIRSVEHFCYKNGEVIKIVPPMQSVTVTLLFAKGKKFSPGNRSFTVGMKLQKPLDIATGNSFATLTDAVRLRKSVIETIWSNEIEWPGGYSLKNKRP